MLARQNTGGASGIPGGLRGSPCPAAHLALLSPSIPAPSTGGSEPGCSEAPVEPGTLSWEQQRVPFTLSPQRSGRSPSWLGLKRAGRAVPAPGGGTAA